MGMASPSAPSSAKSDFQAERRVALQQDRWFLPSPNSYKTLWRSLGLPTFDRLFSTCSYPHHLMVGLDGAGKSTLLSKLSHGSSPEKTLPTVGTSVECVQYLDVRIAINEFGGGEIQRPLLFKHHLGSHWVNFRGIIFVLDASDRERLAEARHELHRLLKATPGDGLFRESCTLISDAPVLIFANKQDLPAALSVDELREALDLGSLPQKDVQIQPCSATTGSGLYPGLKWYVDRFVQRVPEKFW